MIHVKIQVKGRIEAHWSEWFGNLDVSHSGGDTTVLSGALADQAALYGLLTRLWDLRLSLVSVETEAGDPLLIRKE